MGELVMLLNDVKWWISGMSHCSNSSVCVCVCVCVVCVCVWCVCVCVCVCVRARKMNECCEGVGEGDVSHGLVQDTSFDLVERSKATNIYLE